MHLFPTTLNIDLSHLLSSVTAIQGKRKELKEVHDAYHVVTGVVRAKNKFRKKPVEETKSPVLPRHLRLTEAVGLVTNN